MTTTSRAPVSRSAIELLGQARHALLEAATTSDPLLRYATAHLAALRGVAAVLAVSARPATGRTRPRNAWALLPEVAPELSEWAAFFAAGAGKRAAAEAGLRGAATQREADDLVRDTETFLALVAARLHQPHQPVLAIRAG